MRRFLRFLFLVDDSDQLSERSLLADLASHLQLLRFSPDDVITARGDMSKVRLLWKGNFRPQEMYVIRSGEVNVMNSKGKVARTLEEGSNAPFTVTP